MPIFRGFSITLQSSYESAVLPETPSPFDTDQQREQLSDVVSVQVPMYPRSQFWICYSCPPPRVPEDDFHFYYFKLYLNERCISSWGVGERNQWSGRTMFAFSDGDTDFMGFPVVEKVGLFFPSYTPGEGAEDESVGDALEIKIFRSRARKRLRDVVHEDVKHKSKEGNGIFISKVGVLKETEPRRLYTYALVDPVDKPYAVVRYQFQRLQEAGNNEEPRVLVLERERSLRIKRSHDLDKELPSLPQIVIGSQMQTLPMNKELEAWEEDLHILHESKPGDALLRAHEALIRIMGTRDSGPEHDSVLRRRSSSRNLRDHTV